VSYFAVVTVYERSNKVKRYNDRLVEEIIEYYAVGAALML